MEAKHRLSLTRSLAWTSGGETTKNTGYHGAGEWSCCCSTHQLCIRRVLLQLRFGATTATTASQSESGRGVGEDDEVEMALNRGDRQVKGGSLRTGRRKRGAVHILHKKLVATNDKSHLTCKLCPIKDKGRIVNLSAG